MKPNLSIKVVWAITKGKPPVSPVCLCSRLCVSLTVINSDQGLHLKQKHKGGVIMVEYN